MKKKLTLEQRVELLEKRHVVEDIEMEAFAEATLRQAKWERNNL